MSEAPETNRLPDWEAFYRDYRKPGYVPGFEITSKLGGGMFGLVFKAQKQSIGKDYAIKFLKVDDSEVRRAVLLELEQVKYFAQIDHPNLVSIEDRGEVDGIPYLVMAYAGAETLKDRIPGGGKVASAEERDQLLRLYLQACRGVVALHERSLVHFDLKPGNVFLKGSVARVGDYGLSKLVTHSRGSLSMGRGTPYYMAPEMLQRRGDERSDIYSLGVMLYELLAGDVPFRGDSEWEVLKKHEQEALQFPAHMGRRERAIIERAMAKDPAQRFPSVLDLISALTGAVTVGRDAAAAVASAPLSVPPPLPAVRAEGPPPLPAHAPGAEPPPLPAPRAASVAAQAKQQAADFVARSYGPGGRPKPRASHAGRIVLGCVLLFGVTSCWLSARVHSVRGSNARVVTAPSAPRATVPGRADRRSSKASGYESELRAFLSSAASELANPRRSPSVELRTLDHAKVVVPPDLDEYRQKIADLTRSGSFSAGHAQKLERFGHPVFLAAVDRLQDYDYEATDECQEAAIVLQFLQHATAINDLLAGAPAGEVEASTTRRFQRAADRWRELAERFGRDPEMFGRLLVTTGRCPAPAAETGPGGRGN